MIAPTVDPQTRSALVYVDLPASSQGNAPFKAGMYASGAFELGTSGALTVPQQAIAVRDGFSYVFRLNRRPARQPDQGAAGPPPGGPHRDRLGHHGRHHHRRQWRRLPQRWRSGSWQCCHPGGQPDRRRHAGEKIRKSHEFLFPVDQEPDPGHHAVRAADAGRAAGLQSQSGAGFPGHRTAHRHRQRLAAGRRAGPAGNRGGAQDRRLGRHPARREKHLYQGARRRGHRHRGIRAGKADRRSRQRRARCGGPRQGRHAGRTARPDRHQSLHRGPRGADLYRHRPRPASTIRSTRPTCPGMSTIRSPSGC